MSLEWNWSLYLVFFTCFILGMLTLWLLVRVRNVSLTGKKMQGLLGLLFTIVAVVVMIQYVSLGVDFRRYVNETEPRDAQQEQCFRQAVTNINAWVDAIQESYEIHHDRDVIINEIISSGRAPSPDQAQRLTEAIQKADASRIRTLGVMRDNPLLVCGR